MKIQKKNTIKFANEACCCCCCAAACKLRHYFFHILNFYEDVGVMKLIEI